MIHINSQKHIRLVFTLKNTTAMELERWCDELIVRIADMVCEAGHRLLAINCTIADVHVFFELCNDQSLYDLICDIKETNVRWLNEAGCDEEFEWEAGFQSEICQSTEVTQIISQIHNLRSPMM
jgi:hypothetical protein